jgi:hypothetical protein
LTYAVRMFRLRPLSTIVMGAKNVQLKIEIISVQITTNSCPAHKNENKELIKVGTSCPVRFVHVYPIDGNDKKQRIEITINHGKVMEWKLKTSNDLIWKSIGFNTRTFDHHPIN